MDVTTFSERIGFLIGKDDLKTAISEMSFVLKNTKKLNELIIQSARYTDLMSQIRIGIVNYENANITKNQIRFALLDLLREVEAGASSDPDILAEMNALEMPKGQTNIRQTHSGSGDNIAGDKTINH